jgi:hypothetical protein
MGCVMSESRRAREDARRQSNARKDARKKLEDRWEKNRGRSEEGWPPTPLDVEGLGENPAKLNTFDPLGNPITMTLRDRSMRIALREIVRYCVELGNKVRRWENKKEASGEDVMEILGIALMLTNDPAYAAARKANHVDWNTIDLIAKRYSSARQLFTHRSLSLVGQASASSGGWSRRKLTFGLVFSVILSSAEAADQVGGNGPTHGRNRAASAPARLVFGKLLEPAPDVLPREAVGAP